MVGTSPPQNQVWALLLAPIMIQIPSRYQAIVLSHLEPLPLLVTHTNTKVLHHQDYGNRMGWGHLEVFTQCKRLRLVNIK